MLFHRLKFSGLLSFGPQGIDLPMGPLNVLIGPNGSGKSNFLEAISLFHAAPRGIGEPISRMGGIREWLWKGSGVPHSITLEAMVNFSLGGMLRHSLTLADQGGHPVVTDERIEPIEVPSLERLEQCYYRPPQDEQVAFEIAYVNARAQSESEKRLVNARPGVVEFAREFQPDQSLLSLAAFPDYWALWYLNQQYTRIRLYRNWSFGPGANLRLPCNAHARSDFLDESAENLPLVLSQLHGTHKRRLLYELGKLFDGIVDVNCRVTSGTVALFLEEEGGRLIPATRLSDGTLRYLSLLAVLLHPEPPSLICIEEPELGLHPDLLPTLSDLMCEASKRSQVIVTTHSDVLVDALTNRPESVVVCEKHEGQTEMRRLEKKDLAKWLEKYRLGHLWTSGELGGNRW
jgi:predicted ATPase